MPLPSDRVRFNVGGKIFETTATTLAGAGRNSMLGAMLDDEWNAGRPSNGGEYFVDRNPACFEVLLGLLRTGELHVPADVPRRLLHREATYYGLLDHLRTASWGRFDGNRLRLAASVPGQAPGDGTAIRAGPDGGCCVAHGAMVHAYDWTLEELPPVTLDYQRVNDVGYIDADKIVVTACERLGGKDGGGMGLFCSSTGKLRHRFRVAHRNQVKGFTAGVLSFSSSEGKIFAGCKGRCNEYGIGVWDQVTGQQTDFFYEPPGCSLGDAEKLQWLHGVNCLMVATLFPKTDNTYVGLLDFRQKEVVWSWSETGVISVGEKRVLDAAVVEENQSICVVNQYDDLGFMDMRRSAEGGGSRLRWSSRSRLTKGKMPAEERCFPKLAAHDGQLLCSTNDGIAIFCGPEFVLTSLLRRSHGGSICDFSIGGDRLFALHGEENVFDVWEASPLTAK